MYKRIPQTVIDQVLAETSIVDVVSQYVSLKRSGKNWFGKCPFHDERTPSFSVTEEKGMFYCFSCHRGGTAITFLQQLENLSYPQAVVKLAELSNVDMPQEYQTDQLGSQPFDNSEHGRLKKLYQDVSHLYHHILVNTKVGQPALQYLHQRGVSDELINEFNLGYAPPREILLDFLQGQNLDYQFLRKSGLFSTHDDETLHDRFSNRIMFPINDKNGKTVAFSGRTLNPEKTRAKYLNSPETMIFNKRKILFNFDKARTLMRREQQCYLFEGFMDVLSAYQAGVKNGVASMGTSLTEEQIALLSQTTDNLTICYDGDRPGQEATRRALDILEERGQFNLKVISLPDKLDPDEYIKKYGRTQFQALLANQKQTALAFYLHYFEHDRNMANEADQLAYVKDVLQALARVSEPLERDLYLNKVATKLNVDKMMLQARLNELTNNFQQHKAQKVNRQINSLMTSYQLPVATHFSQEEQAERILLYRLLHDPATYQKIARLPDFCFIHEQYQTVYLLVSAYFQAYNTFELATFLEFLKAPQLKELVISLEMANYREETNQEEVDDCLAMILDYSPLNKKIKDITAQLQEAKRLNNTKLITDLTIELVGLLKEQQNHSSVL